MNSQKSISHFQVAAKGSVSEIPIQAGEALFIRSPDEALTQQAIQTARDAGALGIVWFAHPHSAPRRWHTVQHLAAMQEGSPPKPELDFEVTPQGRVKLTNPGPIDLVPQADHHPWHLVITGSPGAFGHGLPEKFLKVELPGGSMNHPEFATKMDLTFPSLHANDTIFSSPGLILQPESIKWTLEAQP